MKPLGIFAILVCCFLSFLSAQDEAVPLEPVPPFSIIPLLEAALAGEVSWRPDWPREIPPDAFAVKGNAVLVTLDTGDGEYRYRRDGEGRPVEFPVLIGGVLVQAEVLRGVGGGILKLSLGSSGVSPDGGEAEPWVVSFPEPLLPDSALLGSAVPPVRVSRGESVYLVVLQEGDTEISETWYDPDGSFAGYYKALINRNNRDNRDGPGWWVLSIEGRSEGGTDAWEYRFESGGHISQVISPRGSFSAVYGAWGLPLYWDCIPAEAPPWLYALQWDEQGLLVRVTSDADERLERADYRYEYDLDGRLNWVERREAGMLSRFGVLTPGPVQRIGRQIIYGTGE